MARDDRVSNGYGDGTALDSQVITSSPLLPELIQGVGPACRLGIGQPGGLKSRRMGRYARPDRSWRWSSRLRDDHWLAAAAGERRGGGSAMQITCLDHAGLYIQTSGGTILCDPWKNPAYFGSWFVFPDNSGLDWDRYGQADFLYVSHLHQDHFDPALLSKHVSRDATCCCPTSRWMTCVMSWSGWGSPDSWCCRRPGGRVRRAAADGAGAGVPRPTGRRGIQRWPSTTAPPSSWTRTTRPADLDELRSFGPYDVHLLQYSGAIWWPWTYELPAAAQRRFGAAKRTNGLDRASRYVTAIGARQVVPFAGPACFLDEDLFGLNDLTRDPRTPSPTRRCSWTTCASTASAAASC